MTRITILKGEPYPTLPCHLRLETLFGSHSAGNSEGDGTEVGICPLLADLVNPQSTADFVLVLTERMLECQLGDGRGQ
ncbi:MAG: hypothetical protein WBK33_08965, partial [Limnochordia bacterium]